MLTLRMTNDQRRWVVIGLIPFQRTESGRGIVKTADVRLSNNTICVIVDS